MDWTKSGRRDAFRYVRVSFPGFVEKEELEGITSCSIEESAFTSLKVSGKIAFEEVPQWAHNIGDDLIRIYSISRLGDEEETICHATMFATNSSGVFTGTRKSGDYSLYSSLKLLQDEQLVEPLTVPAGTNIAQFVAKKIKERGLKVSAYVGVSTLDSDMVFEFGDELLDVCNKLLSKGGYRSLYVDAFGTVCINVAKGVNQQTPVACMSDTDPRVCISAASFDTDFDVSAIPNYVVVISEDDQGNSFRAVAENTDIHSPWSTQRRHRRITRCEKIDKGKSQKELQDYAEELLRKSMMKVEKITIEHLWLPFEIMDSIDFHYSKSQTTGTYSAVKRTREMRPGIPCTTTLRRFVQLAEMSSHE